MKQQKSCGVVPYTIKDNEIFVMLVKQTNDVICFPKGHVEENETEEETAKRECMEETNTEVELVEGFREEEGYYMEEYDAYKTVVYFLGKIASDNFVKQDSEISDIIFCKASEALNYLQYESQKNILQKAIKYIEGRMNQNIISEAIKYIEELFKENADGHDAAHTMRVYKNAERLAEYYPESDKEIILLSALLHDVDDHKLFDTKNNENARRFLEDNGVEPADIERICTIINAVSFSKNRGKHPDTIEGKIVQDADRLDALGAIGIARTFAYGGKHQRSLDDSVKHFYEKLFLLKDEMNTKEAKEMAEERHKFMEDFIKEYQKEN